jgi:hypothetical protein
MKKMLVEFRIGNNYVAILDLEIVGVEEKSRF